MSTTQTPATKGETAAKPVIVKCPQCGKLFDKESAALTPWEPAEYPKAMYKLVPKAKEPSPEEPQDELETVVVVDPEEEKKKAGEGFSDKVPAPKKKAAPAAQPQHEEPKKK